jgi:hypothetical protein
MKLRILLLTAAVLSFSAPLAAQVTDLYLDAPAWGSIGDAQSAFYRLSVEATVHLVLTLQNDHGWSRHALYIQRDTLPTTEEHFASSQEGRPEQVIEIPNLDPGTYYVMVRGIDTFWSGGYSILARTAEQLPSLVLGEALADGVGDAQSRFYRLELPTPAHLVLTLQNDHGWSRHTLYIQRNVLPTTEEHLAGSEEGRPEQIIEIFNLEPGSYYVMARGIDTFWSGGYSILARTAEQLPSLVLDEALADGVGDAQSRFYRLEMATSGHLVLTLRNDHGWSRHALYIQRDVLPTPDYHVASSAGGDPQQVIEVSHVEAGPYYVMVRGIDTFWSGGYSILATDLDHPQPEPDSTLWASTYRGAAGAQVTVRVWAVGLAENARVLLRRDDGATIEAGVTPELEGYLAARFDLTAAALGEYDLVAVNPDGREFIASRAFRVEAEKHVEPWVDLLGRDAVRVGRAQTFYVVYGNRGNADAVGVPLWIGGIPTDATLRLGFDVLPPLQLGDEPVDYSDVPTWFDLGDEIVVPLLLPVIPPDSTGVLRFTLTTASPLSFQLEAWMNPPFFASEVSDEAESCILAFLGAIASWQPDITDCVATLLT